MAESATQTAVHNVNRLVTTWILTQFDELNMLLSAHPCPLTLLLARLADTLRICMCYASAVSQQRPHGDREDMESSDAFICTGWGGGGGGILPPEHGGIRLILPTLFGWKSAKYLTELHFLPHHTQVSARITAVAIACRLS